MIIWQDRAVILGYRRYGETNALVELFSPLYGRHLAVVHGGASKKKCSTLQPATLALANYKARLPEHMGRLELEPIESFQPRFMSDPLMLAGFLSLGALLRFGLPERDPHPIVFDAILEYLKNPTLGAYIHFELLLLQESGFRLQLDRCAVTGERGGLGYISPKTGCAVTAKAAGKWAPQLLPYSLALQDHSVTHTTDACLSALKTTGFFLQSTLGGMLGRPLPESRARFIELLELQNAEPSIPNPYLLHKEMAALQPTYEGFQ